MRTAELHCNTTESTPVLACPKLCMESGRQLRLLALVVFLSARQHHSVHSPRQALQSHTQRQPCHNNDAHSARFFYHQCISDQSQKLIRDLSKADPPDVQDLGAIVRVREMKKRKGRRTDGGGSGAAVGDEVAGAAAEGGRLRQVIHEPDQAQQRQRLGGSLVHRAHLAESAASSHASALTSHHMCFSAFQCGAHSLLQG